MKEEEKKALSASCQELEEILRKKNIRVEGDYRDNYSPGWKFNHWELKVCHIIFCLSWSGALCFCLCFLHTSLLNFKLHNLFLQGVPIRIELGPKDLKNHQLVAVRRDTGAKIVVPRSTADSVLAALLDTVQKALFDK